MAIANIQSNPNQGGSIFSRISSVILNIYSTVITIVGAITAFYAFYTILCNAGNNQKIEGNVFDALRLSFKNALNPDGESPSVMFLEIILSVVVAAVIAGACLGLAALFKWLVGSMHREDNLPEAYKTSIEGATLNVAAIISACLGIAAPVINLGYRLVTTSFEISQILLFAVVSLSIGCIFYGAFKALSTLTYDTRVSNR